MPEPSSSKRRINSATVTLAAAGLLATAAIGLAVFGRSDTAEVAAENNMAAAQAPVPSMGDAIAALNEQVGRNPDSDRDWYLLGLAYRDNGDFAGAERAFRRATQLRPDNADYLAYLGEILLVRGGDNPPAEAEQLFRRALERQPDNPQSRYYLATLKDIRGDHRAAVDELLALLREAPGGAPWEAQVRGAVTSIAQRNNIDIAGRLPPPRPAAASATAAIPGPTREQMEAAGGIPPSQQDAMVRGMVDRLASRLRQNPRDADGWIRLMRSRMVLNDPNAAREALRSGLVAFQDDSATQQRLRTAAAELGVPNG